MLVEFEASIAGGAGITVDGVFIRLGVFPNPEDAAAAYREAAVKYFGEFARWTERNE